MFQDPQKEIAKIIAFIQNTVSTAGVQKLVMGLSGGIDSALVATLCAQALGPEAVTAVCLPYKTSNPQSLHDAHLLAKFVGIKLRIISITALVDSYFQKDAPQADTLRKGNFMARQRMCILYDLSAELPALVVGTSNKSEIYTGFCTIYGDAACAFEPIGHLYKTEVFTLAKTLRIPESIIQKKPSADLWENQTDEEDLGISYARLDQILMFHLDQKMTQQEVLARGFSEQEYNLVLHKIQKSEYKRKMPLLL